MKFHKAWSLILLCVCARICVCVHVLPVYMCVCAFIACVYVCVCACGHSWWTLTHIHLCGKMLLWAIQHRPIWKHCWMSSHCAFYVLMHDHLRGASLLYVFFGSSGLFWAIRAIEGIFHNPGKMAPIVIQQWTFWKQSSWENMKGC